ncbi:hypothetical protein PC116_g19694 [Phytophthora cactorum]|nr:hypothetical protein Pcac1_g17452 [Phytophthora cactorum]KAG2896337.1 hypothetical protein PC114_g15132 [Phytophthora cactorum]KAG4232053.1 hypothetical protein PC116_g19694 [Phytophthora cactorum]
MTTQFQMNRHVHTIPSSKVLEGISNYNRLSGNKLRAETLKVSCRPYHEGVNGGDLWDEVDAVSEACARYDCRETVPEDARDVERVSAREFQPRAVMTPPEDLFGHNDGLMSPRVKLEFESMFKHSAASSFLACLPLAFWKKVVSNTNAYALDQKRSHVTLDELMKILSVLLHMGLIDKGEYANTGANKLKILFSSLKVSDLI